MNPETPERGAPEWKGVFGALLLCVPYALISWGVFISADRSQRAFWITICALLALRGLFAVTEYWFEEIKWRIGGGRALYLNCLSILRANKFPNPSKILHNGFMGYLDVLKYPLNECDDDVRAVAMKEYEAMTLVMLHLSERQKCRYHAAMNRALLDWFSKRWYSDQVG